jgi:hypothetical protein
MVTSNQTGSQSSKTEGVSGEGVILKNIEVPESVIRLPRNTPGLATLHNRQFGKHPKNTPRKDTPLGLEKVSFNPEIRRDMDDLGFVSESKITGCVTRVKLTFAVAIRSHKGKVLKTKVRVQSFNRENVLGLVVQKLSKTSRYPSTFFRPKVRVNLVSPKNSFPFVSLHLELRKKN